jgi:hypothetical protein
MAQDASRTINVVLVLPAGQLSRQLPLRLTLASMLHNEKLRPTENRRKRDCQDAEYGKKVE